MFKKMIIVCAGLILSTKAANAQIFAPVQQRPVMEQPAPQQYPTRQQYPTPQQAPAENTQSFVFVGELDGKPLVLQAFPGNGYSFTGRMTFGILTLPCDGENHEGHVTGTVHGNNGKELAFGGAVQNGRFEMTMAGQSVTLFLQNGSTPAPQQPQYRPQPTPAPVQTGRTDATIDRSSIEVVKTSFFNIPLPRGWRHQEDKADALVISPDGMTVYGVLGRNVAAGTTAEQFMRDTLAGFRVQNLQVLNQQTIDNSDSTEFDAVVTFTGPDGRQREGFMKAYMMKGSNFAMLIHAATPAEEFEANGKLVVELAGNIAVVKQTAAPQSPSPLAQPVGYSPLGR